MAGRVDHGLYDNLDSQLCHIIHIDVILSIEENNDHLVFPAHSNLVIADHHKHA